MRISGFLRPQAAKINPGLSRTSFVIAIFIPCQYFDPVKEIPVKMNTADVVRRVFQGRKGAYQRYSCVE